MFDIGWSELLVIAIVAIVVVGPKELPRLMRTFGYYAGKLRHAAADFQRQFDEALRETEVEDVRKNIEEIRRHAQIDLDTPVMLPKPASASPQTAVGPSSLPSASESRSAKPKAALPAKRKPAPKRRKAQTKS